MCFSFLLAWVLQLPKSVVGTGPSETLGEENAQNPGKIWSLTFRRLWLSKEGSTHRKQVRTLAHSLSELCGLALRLWACSREGNLCAGPWVICWHRSGFWRHQWAGYEFPADSMLASFWGLLHAVGTCSEHSVTCKRAESASRHSHEVGRVGTFPSVFDYISWPHWCWNWG